MNIVGLSAALSAPSTTRMLVDYLLAEVAVSRFQSENIVDLATFRVELAHTFRRAEADQPLETALRKIEVADILVVATPVVGGSCPDLLGQFLDLVRRTESRTANAIIGATDSGDCNGLLLESSLRPLLRSLGYHPVSRVVYARDDDFADSRPANASLSRRARMAIWEALGL
jgi:FMN reductase